MAILQLQKNEDYNELSFPIIDFIDIRELRKILNYESTIGHGATGIACLYTDDQKKKYIVKFFFPMKDSNSDYEIMVMSKLYEKLNGCHEQIICYEGYGRIEPSDDEYQPIVDEMREVLADTTSDDGSKELLEYMDGSYSIMFVISKYIEGYNLYEVITGENNVPITMAKINVYNFSLWLIGILSLLHKKGIIHTDIKPDNIIYTPEKCTSSKDKGSLACGHFNLIDFGTACIVNPEQNTKRERGNILICKRGLVGTEYYTPRQFKKSALKENDIFLPIDYVYQDVYASMVTIYNCLIGGMPFDDYYRFNDVIENHQYNKIVSQDIINKMGHLLSEFFKDNNDTKIKTIYDIRKDLYPKYTIEYIHNRLLEMI